MKIQLIPKRKKGVTVLPSSYIDKETSKNFYLIDNGRTVVTTLTDSDRMHKFQSLRGEPIEVNISEEKTTGVGAKPSVLLFLKNHPAIRTDGYENKNLVEPLFELVIKSDKINLEFQRLMERLEVLKTISSMDHAELYDAAFAIGGNPRGMEPNELFLFMVGSHLDGRAMDFRFDFMNLAKLRSEERVARVYAYKAIEYGIVQKQDSVFKVSGQIAGTSVDDVVGLFLGNTDMFNNYVKPEVDKHDKLEHKKVKTFEIDGLPGGVEEIIPVAAAKNARKK